MNFSTLIGVDLHAHSDISDGVLSPTLLVKLAKSNGAALFALTDHDCVEGLAEASKVALEIELPFLKGVELSVTWKQDVTLHIVGLDIDPKHPLLLRGLAKTQEGRLLRLQKMHDAFSKEGIEGVYDGALKQAAANPKLVGRVHVARYLVQLGLFQNTRSVFEHCLVPGKMGYASHFWISLEEAIDWILQAKGLPVLAHPSRYGFNHSEMKQLLEAFVAFGGIALELGCSHETHSQTLALAEYAKEFGLEISVGSDFHTHNAYSLEAGFARRPSSESSAIWKRWL